MEWISIEKELPENAQTVLSCGKYEGGIVIAMHVFLTNSFKTWWLPIQHIDLEEITHWMPLPKLPDYISVRKEEMVIHSENYGVEKLIIEKQREIK